MKSKIKNIMAIILLVILFIVACKNDVASENTQKQIQDAQKTRIENINSKIK